ncbi:hypothetical protein Trichorick_01740 (plasmid) [Candidatus Trichorickettsia mobilis]|nr:hypothetical protein Trichorick_01740 [Candidatus Trichorickettsia mobilis]
MALCGNLRLNIAINRASVKRVARRVLLVDHPITALEYKSINTHRYSHPSCVWIYVMSVTHFWLGAAAVKFCSNKLGATGLLWLESVVTLNFRLALAVSHISFIRFATILRVHAIPLYFNSW